MDSFTIKLVAVIVALLFLKTLFNLLFSGYKDTRFGFRGKLVYADTGRKARTFVNKVFGLSSKPDFIYEIEPNKHAYVEYKGRAKHVYPSDEAQVKATVIAARTKYNIQKAYVQTDTFRKEIPVNKPDAELYEEIKHLVELSRKIKNKEKVTECYPQYMKCKTCSMASRCER